MSITRPSLWIIAPSVALASVLCISRPAGATSIVFHSGHGGLDGQRGFVGVVPTSPVSRQTSVEPFGTFDSGILLTQDLTTTDGGTGNPYGLDAKKMFDIYGSTADEAFDANAARQGHSPDSEISVNSPGDVVTPEPASLILLGSGLIAIARAHRRSRREP